ncbi:hypothetical protein KKA69_05235, partial [Patescibacteria group bacterium]|nr:hypothetical protein [Patescibacteria group bacterium]
LKDKMRTSLNLDISFKEKAVENYDISVSKEAVKEVQKEEMQKVISLPPSQIPSQPEPRGKGDFIKQLDKDNDGRVSRSEFPGPDNAFNRMDRNDDGFIDENEAPQDHGFMQRQGPGGGRR